MSVFLDIVEGMILQEETLNSQKMNRKGKNDA